MPIAGSTAWPNTDAFQAPPEDTKLNDDGDTTRDHPQWHADMGAAQEAARADYVAHKAAATGVHGVGAGSVESTSHKGAANGYASLGSDGKIPTAQMPALVIGDTFTVANQAAMLALSTAQRSDIAIRTDTTEVYMLTSDSPSTLADWLKIEHPDAVVSVDGATGTVTLATDGAAGTGTKRTLGTSATSACAGNDSRLSDSRSPSGAAAGDLAGTYPNPTVAASAITDTKVAAANKDGVAGTASMRTLGTGAQQAAAGNDSRLSDPRTPTAHATSHEPTGSDPLTQKVSASVFTAGVGSCAIPSWAKAARISCWGPAGGGGSGRKGAVSTIRCGGGSGGGGGYSEAVIPTSELGAGPINVTVGSGGAGGTAQTSNSNDGVDGGNASGPTFFGATAATAFVVAGTGSGGKKGTATTGTAGTGGTGVVVGAAGSAASTTGLVGVAGLGGLAGSGGGSGGGLTNANPGATSAGGAGNSPGVLGGNVVGGPSGGAADSNGNNGTQRSASLPGTSGSGGGSSVTVNGGDGGNGGTASGGGGGGAALDSIGNSGKGGNGGDGLCVVVFYG